MINQKLFDYIRQQLQQSFSREEIKNSLLANSWKEKDIEYGFLAISNEQSPSDNISVSQKQNVSVSPNAPKSTRTILTACLIGALFIGGGLFSYFYFRSTGEIEQARPMLTNDESNQTVELAPLTPTGSQNVEGEDQKISASKDCGISKSLSVNRPLNEIDPEQDSALVCLGRNIINDCKASKTVLDTYNAGKVLAEVKTKGTECRIKLSYGEVNQIPLESQKEYANQDIECPVGVLMPLLSTAKRDISSAPGGYVISLYFSFGLVSMDPEGLKKNGCIGTLLP